MCGRTRCCFSSPALANITRVPRDQWRDGQRYQPMNNMTPGMDFPILYQDSTGQRRLRVMKWGLIPAFTKKGAKLDYFRMFNARSETVESKYSFRKLIYSQRCVVILNGYYEWKLVQGQKQPYYVTTKSHMPLKVAAIFDIFESGGEGEVEGENLYSFTMLTCPAHDSISWLHNRQPLILSDTQVEEWIDTNLPPNASIVHRAGGSPALEESHDGGESGEESNEEQSSDSKHLSYLPADIISYTVTPNMTSPTYQDADSCAPFTPRLSRSITSFFKQKAAQDDAPTQHPADDIDLAESEPSSTTPPRKKRTRGQGVVTDYFTKKRKGSDP